MLSAHINHPEPSSMRPPAGLPSHWGPRQRARGTPTLTPPAHPNAQERGATGADSFLGGRRTTVKRRNGTLATEGEGVRGARGGAVTVSGMRAVHPC